MFIELTDHLRCPQPHAEAFLVLLPGTMSGRRVIAGHLGCPICGWAVAWEHGVPDFGGGWRSNAAPSVDAEALHAFLGIDGPGGWVALAGSAGALAESLATLLPGVGMVAVNPPEAVRSEGAVSVIVSGAWPIKTHAMRGVVLGADASAWRDAALGSALPGLRVVGQGEPPSDVSTAVLGAAGGTWVATRR